MKCQLASAFLVAAVACGGRGEENPAVPVDGIDRSRTEAAVPVDGDTAAPQTNDDPAPVAGEVDAPPPFEDPLLVDGRRVRAQPTQAPVPAASTSEAQPSAEQWRARAPERYVISTCGTGFGIPSCSVEVVDGGRLVSRSNRFLPSEPWAAAPIDDGIEPVASLFEQARRSIDGCTTSFQLDPVYAYPAQVYFDCGEEGFGVRVACFEPDTLDGSLCQ